MNARDIPGFGDLTNRHHPQSPDYPGDDDDTATANIEAFMEWAESFKDAAQKGNKRQMEQARLFVVSLMNDIGGAQ